MSVDRNEKIWAFSNSGNLMHAFVQVWKNKAGEECPSHLRAMCRGTIARTADTRFSSANYAIGICTRCEKLANAMWDRAEASMEPADPYSDGFHTVDETTADVNRETEKKPATIPADMNRELLRQARAVAEAHKRLFPTDVDITHVQALAVNEAQPETEDALTLAHREAMATLPQRSGRTVTQKPQLSSLWAAKKLFTTTDPVALRANREARRLHTVEADHEEALKMDYERDTWRARKMAIVVEADHEEALKMNRAWDKSVAGYAHHYGGGADVVRRPAAPALRNDSPLQNLRRFLDQD